MTGCANSTGLRRVVDVAFPQVGNAACSGHKVLVVVEHDEAMMCCRGTDQQIYCRQRAMSAVPNQPILCGLDPPPGALGNGGIWVQRIKHLRHLFVLIKGASRTPELNALRMTGSDDSQRDDFSPSGSQCGLPQDPPQSGRGEQIADHAAESFSAARWRSHSSKSHPAASAA